MSESLGSILELQSRSTASSNVNLLIITEKNANLQAIAASLYAAEIDFNYDIINLKQPSINPPRLKYSAILYDNVRVSDRDRAESLMEKLQCWCHLYPDTPLILITDPLGDERAVQSIQSGVSGYLLRQELDRLPIILEKSLFDFVSKQTIVQQQQGLIRQQQAKIEHLQAEVQSRHDSQQIQQDLIRQQQAKIEHLETQQQNWQQQKIARQEHISYLVHELRNPISAIIGFARGLREQYFGTLNAKQMQYARLLVDSGEYLLALVENYLNIAKIEANQQTLELQTIGVEEICQSSILMLQEKAQQKGLKLNLELQQGIDFCTADSSRLKQILINLLSNAIKFTERGSVTLKVTLKEDFLHFAVIDTGVGISAENLAKLFKPFPQISHHHENTGLGLTLSQKLAQLHGGEITVTSELGKGSCFTLMIPQH